MNSLAHTPKPDPSMAIPMMPSTTEPPKVQYPKLTLNGDQAEQAGLNDCKIGQEYTVTLHIKATKLGNDRYDSNGSDKPIAEFDVLAADDPEDAGGDSPTEETAEEDGNIVKRPKSRVLSVKQSGFKAPFAK